MRPIWPAARQWRRGDPATLRSGLLLKQLLGLSALLVSVDATEALATEVSGEQSGTWTPAGNPYLLVGDVVVPPGTVLTIEPGVNVFALGHYQLTVEDEAVLLAVGTSLDQIHMTAEDSAIGWGGLRLEAAADATTISYCVIEYASNTPPSGNTSTGGAITVKDCSPTISNNVLRFNSVHNSTRNGLGGAIQARLSSAIIEANVITENSADNGGGICTIDSGTAIIRGNHIADNHAENSGGGMYLAVTSSPIIEYNTITRNSAGGGFGGGGITVWTGNFVPTIHNNVITHNTAHAGGGLYLRYNPSVVDNNVIAFNSATSGGAIHVINQGAEDAPLVTNCILWGNTASVENDQIDLYDDVSTAVSVSYSNVQGGWPGVGNIDANPLFVDADGEDNIAGTDDDSFRVSPESPCIDAGDNTAVPVGTDTDLDGNPRFLDVPETPDTGNGDPPVVDMGAYESLGGGCLALTSQETVCHPDGSTFTLSVEGMSACTGDTVMATFTASGGAVGEDLCFTMMVNDDQGGFCCSTQVCVPVPDCSEALGDLDGDGIVGVLDLMLLLGQFGPCTGGCWADMDHDGMVGVTDLLILLGNWD